MAKSIPAVVTPEVLKWARDLDLIRIDEISLKLKVDITKVENWGNGTEFPTLTQAKNLAKQYRVPFAYFYLPNVPQKTKRLDKVDYRTFNNVGYVDMSRELRWFLRDIEERRDIMLELYLDNEQDIINFTSNLTLDSKPEEIAEAIRSFLNLTQDVQKTFRKPEKALSYCISQIEMNDFLVFQSTKIGTEEMRGLSIGYDNFPIIALNRKDEYSARLFTLFHELAHIFTNSSGICNNMNIDDMNDNKVELLCNHIAGLALVPDNMLKQNQNIKLIKTYGFDDSYVLSIARDFAVSKEVIINRLCAIKVISKEFYFTTLNRYSEEYKTFLKNKKKGGFVTPPMDKGSQLGKLYTRTVLSAYRSDSITTKETSAYLLGLKMNHFEKIERWCY